MKNYSIREMSNGDLNAIADYWLNSNDEHRLGMGMDLNKLPSRAKLIKNLENQLKLPLIQKNSYCLIWEVNGIPIGHCNTNPIYFGEEAFMHLHIWENDNRKKGLGTHFLRLSIPIFFKALKLKRLICEPYALNQAPGKALENSGFQFIREYTTTPGSLSFEQQVNRWEMSIDRFYECYVPRDKRPEKKAKKLFGWNIFI